MGDQIALQDSAWLNENDFFFFFFFLCYCISRFSQDFVRLIIIIWDFPASRKRIHD